MTNFNRARALFDNHTATAISLQVSPAALTGYEITNLQKPSPKSLCKVASSTITFTVQPQVGAWVSALVLCGMAYSPTAQVRVRGNDTNTNWDTSLFDSGLQAAMPQPFGYGSRGYGVGGYGGAVGSNEAPYYQPVRYIYFPNVMTYAYYQIEIDNPDGDGTTGVGVAALTDVTQLLRNFSTGWTMEPIDTTDMIKTAGGGEVPGRAGERYQRVTMQFKHIPESQKMTLHNKLTTLGRGQPWFIDMHPESGKGAWTGLYVQTEKYSGFKTAGAGINKMSMTAREYKGE